jgi:hypothetical protein
MTTIRRIPTSKIDGNDSNSTDTDEIRPYGEIAVYVGDNNKLELLMFDGVRTHLRSKVLNKGTFYGGDADSGDGEGYDTIKLIPDAELLYNNNSDQYIIVDPTGGEPNHIHIRAGGTIDQSSTDLFLGGEKNNVRVSDINDRVTISTDAGEGAFIWTFNNSGGLSLPNSGVIESSDYGGFSLRSRYDTPINNVIGSNIYVSPGQVSINYQVEFEGVPTPGYQWNFNSVTRALDLADGGLKFANATVQTTDSLSASGTIITVPLNAAGDTIDYVGGASVLEIPKNSDTNQIQAGWIITFTNGGAQRTVAGVVDSGEYWAVTYDGANPALADLTYPVTIQSADYAAETVGKMTITIDDIVDTKSYEFGANGELTLPSGGTIAEGVVTDNPTIELTPAMPDVASQKLVIKGGVFEELDNYHLHLTTGALNETSIFLGTDEHNVRTTIEGKIQITTPGENSNVWEFGTDGSLTFPNQSGKINPGVSDGGGLQIEAEYDFEIKVTQFEDDPTIWSFAGNDITFPDGSIQSTAYTGPQNTLDGDSISIGRIDAGEVDIYGDVEFNNGTTAFQAGNTVTFNGPVNFTNATITGLNIDGSANTGAITFDDNEIQANPLDTVGTQITVNSNYISVTSQNSNVFNLTKSADTDQVLVGWIIRGDGGGPQTITNKIDNGSYWSFFVAMGIQTEYPITIESADYQVGSDPQLILTVAPDGVAATSWTFDTDGTLTLPAGGDIVDSTGVSQTAQRVEGSWTVTAGTDTYSFTVPMDGTYVMWVKGNIPNGIITWNATLSVSNNNVPAIGSQYAWNYTDGGSPILLTAIPNQIKGTEGGISTDNTYVGTTSNRFDFTIANTSGASQTVFYGYTKI